jgi:phage baseplate assembly protein W
MALYNGFSTLSSSKKFKLTDFELVKQDLQNHFAIRKGEKLMNPEFGTIIWDMLFEPLNEDTKNAIIQDIKKIVANDPRIAVQNVIVTQFDRGLQIELEIIYISTNQVDKLAIQFDQQSQKSNTIL